MSDAAPALSATVSATVSAAVAEIVPLVQHKEFYGETTDEQRLRIAYLLQCFEEIRTSPAGIVAACHKIALENPGKGFSAGNLKTLYYAFRTTRDWRVLVPKWRGPTAIPDEFGEWFRLRVEQNKRENPARAVMMQIRDEWIRGESIPGYGTWREYYATQFPEQDTPDRYPLNFFPRGWSQSNLYTKQSTKAERALARRGIAAAKKYLPHVVRDTSKLRPMELIVIDDFETDILVEARNPVTGRYEIVTCTGLLALDVATRRRLGFGLKPRFKGDEGTRQAITRADVQGLLHSVFSSFGLPKSWGVTILCENAAAAISEGVELMLQTLLGIQVARTGLLAHKTLANGFMESGGKPYEKGWIESTFNIGGNHAGAFPGQKGASYQLKPGDLEARLLYAQKLLATEGLTDAQIEELDTSFFPLGDAIDAYTRIFDFLERRTQHSMQGFPEIRDYLLPDRSRAVTRAEAQRLPKEVIVQCTPQPRRQSPLERWEELTAGTEWVKPAEHALTLLLLTPKRCKLNNLRITFSHLSEGYTFADADSPVMALSEGTEFLGYFDPAQPNRLYCTTLDGKYVGPVRRRGAVDIRDREAIAAEQGEITRLITKHVLAPVRERHASEDSALEKLKADNAAKLAAWLPQPPPATAKGETGVTARLANAQPGAQSRHAAAASSLATGIAVDAATDTARKHRMTDLQRAQIDTSSLL